MKNIMIFPVLVGIMRRKKITVTDIAHIAGVTIPSAYNKMSGKTDWTLTEMRKIKEALRCRESLDTLFFKEISY